MRFYNPPLGYYIIVSKSLVLNLIALFFFVFVCFFRFPFHILLLHSIEIITPYSRTFSILSLSRSSFSFITER